MNIFMDLVSKFSLEQLIDCKDILSNNIAAIKAKQRTLSSDITNFVDYHNTFLSEPDVNKLNNELQLLELSKTKPGVQNVFISSQCDPYVWKSKGGEVVNTPLLLDNFPVIKSILTRINQKYGCDLNSVLVSQYKNGSVGTRWHKDDEAEMDPSQPICVVSVGSKRQVDFVNAGETDFRRTCLTLSPSEGSIYLMKPGCQESFLHRVKQNKKVKTSRISLSFRRFMKRPTSSSSNSSDVTVPLTPVKNLIAKFDSSPSDASFQTPGSAVRPVTQLPQVEGYSPFLSDQVNTHGSQCARNTSLPSIRTEKAAVIFGTSITSKIDEDRMSNKYRTVFNCSMSGAKISDITEMARDFCVENSSIISKVDKVVVSVGTNDIKYFNGHKYNVSRRFSASIHKLVDTLKFLFPHAMIVFQTVLPIRVLNKYTGDTFHSFNRLLRDICGRRGCIFLDCFADFLDESGDDINTYFYRDDLHLNLFGLMRLCRALKFAIHRSIFNPIMRESCSPFYYL